MYWLNRHKSPLKCKWWTNSTLTLILVVAIVASKLTTASRTPEQQEDVDFDDANSEERLKELKAGELANAYNKPILGNLVTFVSDNKFRDIFKLYFKKVLALNDEALQNIKVDDPRSYRPTPKLCLYKFVMFKNDGYILRNPIDLIPIDACLEWLFNKDPKRIPFDEAEVELLPKAKKREVKTLKADARLRSMFEKTKLKKGTDFPVALRDTIYKYLARLADINAENPRSECNGLWLTAYNDFIEDDYLTECEDEDDCPHFGWVGGDEDPYLMLLLESTRFAARRCYGVTNNQMHDLMVDEYESNKPTITVMRTAAKKQMDDEKWSKQILMILQLVVGANKKDKVDLTEVVRTLTELRSRRPDTVSRFLDELGNYAIQNVDLKNTANDGQGAERYRKAMFQLCRPFIDQELFMDSLKDEDEETEKKPFDFYGLVYSLVRLTNHLEIFGITKSMFEQDVVIHKWQGVYLSTFACQIISTTFAELDYTIKDKPRFKITFPSDLQLEEWPVDQTAIQAFIHKHEPIGAPTADKAPAKFGAKFNNLFHKSTSGDSDSNGKKSDAKVPSLEWINFWKDSYGKYPTKAVEMPGIHEIYPELPDDLSKTFKKLTAQELKAKYPNGMPSVYQENKPVEPVVSKKEKQPEDKPLDTPKIKEDNHPAPSPPPTVASQVPQMAPPMEPIVQQPFYPQQPAPGPAYNPSPMAPQSPYNPMLMIPPSPMHPAMFPPPTPMHPAQMMLQTSQGLLPQQPAPAPAAAKETKKKSKWPFKGHKKSAEEDEATTKADNNALPLAMSGYSQLMQLGNGLGGFPPQGAGLMPNQMGYNHPAQMGLNGFPLGVPPGGMAPNYPGAMPGGMGVGGAMPGLENYPGMSPIHGLGYGGPNAMGGYNNQPPMSNYANDAYYRNNNNGRSHEMDSRRQGGYEPSDRGDRNRDRDRDRRPARNENRRHYNDDDDDRNDDRDWDRKPDRRDSDRGGRDYGRGRDDRDYDDDRHYGGGGGGRRDEGRWESDRRNSRANF